MATKTYRGSCHCGAVTFEADIDLAVAGTGKCNCTSCWKRRYWSVRARPEAFRALGGEAQMTGPKGACAACGVSTYSTVPASDWNEHAYVAINVATLDNLEPAELVEAPVQYFDGRADNWWNAPAETRHL